MKKIIISIIAIITSILMFSFDEPVYNIRPHTLKVVILCGQSNMEGARTTTYSSTYSGFQKSYIYYKADTTTAGVVINYHQQLYNSWHGADSLVGPDVSFGKEYYDRTGEPILMIKYAEGSSVLCDDGSSFQSRGIWQVDANNTRANGKAHYRKLLNKFLIPCILNCKNRGINLEFVSFFWCQGESDANVLYSSSHYQTELIRLIDSVKVNLNRYGVLSPKFKPIITRLNDVYTPQRPYLYQIRTAQQNVVNHYGGYLINADNFLFQYDNIHFSGDGQVEHGIKAATLLVDSILP